MNLSPTFPVIQPGKVRMVTDFKCPNRNIEAITYHQDTPTTIRQMLATDCWDYANKFDIAEAFTHLPHCTKDKPYLRLIVLGRVYELDAAVFGLSCIPRTFYKVTRIPVMIIRANGIPLSLYVDDGIGFAKSQKIGALHLLFAIETFQFLGFHFKYEKLEFWPTMKLTHLGFIWDLEKRKISIPMEKLRRLRKVMKYLVMKKKASVRLLAQVSGLLVSMREGLSLAMAYARPVMRILRDSLRESESWNREVHLLKELIDSLTRFIPHLQAHNGNSYLQ
jgi:hypothetical protein